MSEKQSRFLGSKGPAQKQEETEGACRTANFTISDFGNSIFSDDLDAKTSSNEQFGCLLKEILGFLVGLLVKII